jgi:hypothetical protein
MIRAGRGMHHVQEKDRCMKGMVPIPAAALSKAWVFGHSLAGIMGSNPTGGMDVCFLSVVCCQVEVSASG